jgi:hypothetical protein
MAKSTTFCNDLMKLIFQAVAIANIADNAGAAPLTDLYLSLHTGDPGAGGNQLTNETTYSNYLRVSVVRSALGWTVSSNQASNTGLVQFAQCGVTGATITHVAVGTASSGAGKILYSGALNNQLAVAQLIQPQFSIGALVAQET